MGTLTIVGLGPGHPRYLTREAWEVLESATEIWLRTTHHPTVAGLPAHLTRHSFDHLYEKRSDFAQVYEAIVEEVWRLAHRPAGAIYAVPGHPLVGETTVKRLLERAAEENRPVRVVEGLSFVAPALTALRLDGLAGLQTYDALELAAQYHPLLNPDLPALIGQLYNRRLAADVKLTLMNQYPDDHPVTLLHAVATAERRLVRLPLHALDRQEEIAHLTTLYVPPLAGVTSFEGLQNTVAHLRAPDGCPWDRRQTHESMRRGLLEEAYEVVTAIDEGDRPALQEELGDLLLHIIFQAQIATEEGEFQMAQIIAGIDAKLKHRHPHVWGDARVRDEKEVVARWEELKRQEKQERHSVLDGVPTALPALQQADLYSRKAARVGFDWADAVGVAEKVREELAEVEAAQNRPERERELGDLLFAIVNWARWLGVDAETALRQANRRFARRFREVERLAHARGAEVKSLPMETLESLWQEAKKI